MKKLVKTSLVVLASLGLFGCSGNKSNVTTAPTPSSNSTPTSTAPVTHTLAFEVEGTLQVGETLSVTGVTLDGATLTPTELSNLTVSASDASAFDINGRKLKCMKDGTFTITATYNGTTATKEVTIEKGITYSTVGEVRAVAKDDEYTEVYVKGVITATSGSSAFLQDSTGGIYIYNFFFQSTDTACENNTWKLGETVEIHCYVTAYNKAPQLTYSLKDASGTYVDLEGRYANVSETKLDTPATTTITETELKALEVADTGKMFKFVATYQSGEVSTSIRSYLSFKVGDTSIQLGTDGSSKKMYDKKIEELKAAFDALGLEAGDEVEITAPLYSVSSSSKTFSYLSQGTSVVKHVEKDTLYAKYTGDEKVGQTLSFTASYNDVAVTPTLTATTGADLVTIDGTSVTLNKVGDVVIEVSYMDGETKKTKEISFTIASADPVAINTIDAGNSYYIKGVVTGVSTQGFTVTDATGTAYAHMKAAPSVALGDVVTVEGEASEYNGCTQFTQPEVVKLDEASTITVPAAVELTTAIADSFVKTTATPITDIVKYKWTSTVTKDSNGYFLLNLDGSDTKIEYSYYSGTLVEGNTYNFEGYYLGYNTKYNYATMLLTSVKEKAPTEVSVKLDKTTASVEIGKTVTLTPTVKLPENVTDNSVTWTTADETVATVADGVVTGVKAGTTTITATSVADSTKSATCEITVTEAVAGATTVEIAFDANFNKDFTTISTTEVTKTVDGITMTWLKNNSTTDIALSGEALKYTSPIRLYKGHSVKFDAGTKKIKSVTTASDSSKAFNATNVSADSGTVGTDSVTFDTTVGSVTLTMSNQVRLNSITFVLVD